MNVSNGNTSGSPQNPIRDETSSDGFIKSTVVTKSSKIVVKGSDKLNRSVVNLGESQSYFNENSSSSKIIPRFKGTKA